MKAGNAARNGILKAFQEEKIMPEIIVKPLADGGEGTTEALIDGLGGQLVSVKVEGSGWSCKIGKETWL